MPDSSSCRCDCKCPGRVAEGGRVGARIVRRGGSDGKCWCSEDYCPCTKRPNKCR